MSTSRKDTIYIDVDDEITSIIEKVRSSPQKIVALVLPKRAATLQSIVNMKLLKRSADEVKKHLVLITSEASLLPLAGAVGVHVAKTLLSQPTVPPPPVIPDADNTNAGEAELVEDVPLDSSKPVGVLAGLPATGEEETIEVDNDEPVKNAVSKKTAKSKKANKGLNIPDFNKFRMRLLLGALAAVLLLVGLYLANFVLPSANIVIKTDTKNMNSSLNFTSNPNTADFDEENAVVPAVNKELKKNEAQKAPATGQKNVGQKAKGTVRLVNCNQSDKLSDTNRTVPAGTAVSSGNFTFILSESVEVEPSSFIGNICTKNKKTDPVDVVAQNPGDAYNLSARDYSVAGFPSMTALGSDMSGGTNQIVRVVSQADIDNLRQKIVDGFTNSAKEQLNQELKAEALIPLNDTFQVGQPVAVNTPNVNTEAQEVNVSVTMSFTMQGVKEEHITKLIEKSVEGEFDADKQEIIDHGLDKAIFQIDERKPSGEVSYSLETLVIAGPDIDEAALKKEIAGKKRGETQNIIQNWPSVKDVTVDYKPFWVSKTPRKANKVTIIIEGSESNEDSSNQQ